MYLYQSDVVALWLLKSTAHCEPTAAAASAATERG